ncbi:MAG: hypothetical protein ACI8WB_001809 [Phenylobacterium sp.]|jgi:hypothetical protein
MWFWIKNVTLLVFLGVTAWYLLNYQDIHKEDEVGKGKAASRTAIKEQQQDAERGTFSSSSSKAAKGLSNFYGKVKEELLGNSKTLGDGFVLKLDKPKDSIDQQLQKRAEMVTPGNFKFQGEFEGRRFRTGDTIREILKGYAEEEGLELYWRLERDYVIKHYFEVESNFVAALGSVAKALDSDFEKDVYAWYCPRERAAIITYEHNDYLKSNCQLADAKNQQKE